MMTELETFREEKDEFFRSHPQSPLTPQQKREFKGLNYFSENKALRLEVSVEPFAEREVIDVQTTTGEVRKYQRFARFSFEVDGQPAALTIYATPHGFFLPFVDALANKETYPAGRYLEPEPLGGNKFLVDFNVAYNPFCAYSPDYSCPLTPFENRLKVAIRAGEKIFEGH